VLWRKRCHETERHKEKENIIEPHVKARDTHLASGTNSLYYINQSLPLCSARSAFCLDPNLFLYGKWIKWFDVMYKMFSNTHSPYITFDDELSLELEMY